MSHPRPTSVYLYRDVNGFLIYVGITSRSVVRQHEHAAGKEWWPFVASQSVEHFETREAAATRERRLIEKFRPPFNVHHNPDHVATRAAFLAYQASIDGMGPLELVLSQGKRVPLTLETQSDTEVAFRTSLAFATAAQRLRLPEKGRVPIRYSCIAGGGVKELVHDGPSAVLIGSRRRHFTVGATPQARVAILGSGEGVAFELRSVIACSDDEYRELRKDGAA